MGINNHNKMVPETISVSNIQIALRYWTSSKANELLYMHVEDKWTRTTYQQTQV